MSLIESWKLLLVIFAACGQKTQPRPGFPSQWFRHLGERNFGRRLSLSFEGCRRSKNALTVGRSLSDGEITSCDRHLVNHVSDRVLEAAAVHPRRMVHLRQQEVISYLRTENQVLCEKLGTKRILLNDDQRRRPAVQGQVLSRKGLEEFATLLSPDTILRWHRQLIA